MVPTALGVGREFVESLQPAEMLAQLSLHPRGVDSYDSHGWTCLHWAAHLGRPSYVAALLDSGARFLAQTTLALKIKDYEWPAGTTPETLARWPEGERPVGEGTEQGSPSSRSAGGKPHQLCRGMLAAAARGAFAKRRSAKQRGDELVSRGDVAGAVQAYSECLGAVLQVGDSAALVVRVHVAAFRHASLGRLLMHSRASSVTKEASCCLAWQVEGPLQQAEKAATKLEEAQRLASAAGLEAVRAMEQGAFAIFFCPRYLG